VALLGVLASRAAALGHVADDVLGKPRIATGPVRSASALWPGAAIDAAMSSSPALSISIRSSRGQVSLSTAHPIEVTHVEQADEVSSRVIHVEKGADLAHVTVLVQDQSPLNVLPQPWISSLRMRA
jgi:hypothetical protein